MILTCPRCSSQFAVPRELIGPQGRKVQCSSCQFVWKANAGLSSAAQAPDEQQGGQLDNTAGFALEAPAPQAAVAQEASSQAPVPQAPVPQVPAPPPIPAPAPQAAGPQAPDPQAAGPQAPPPQPTAPGAPAPPAPDQPGGEPLPPNAAPPAPDQPPVEGEKEELEETIPDFLSSFADGGAQDGTPQQAGNQQDGAPPVLGNIDGGPAGMPGGPPDDGGSIPDIDSVDEDIFSQPEHRPVKTVKKGPIAAWVVLLMMISGTLGVMFIERESLIASYPGLNGLYNLIGLGDSSLAYGISFGPTETSIQIQAGQPRTLFIEGTLTNTREDIAPAPFIKGTLYNSRRENLKTWFFRPEKTSILPGEEIRYNTSLVDPPRGVTEINVTLASEEEAAEFEAGGAEEQQQPSDGE